MKSNRNSEYGFTLLEVMVAVALFGLSVLFLLQLFSAGLGSAKLTDDYTKAVIYARGKMAEALLDRELSEGVSSGTTEDGFKWSVEVNRSDLVEGVQNFRLLQVITKVNSRRGRDMVSLASLKTIRLDK